MVENIYKKKTKKKVFEDYLIPLYYGIDFNENFSFFCAIIFFVLVSNSFNFKIHQLASSFSSTSRSVINIYLIKKREDNRYTYIEINYL
jgi:hypothetical protein